MNGQSRLGRPSPLRNSKAANRPFQSPFRSVLSPADQKVGNEEKAFKDANLPYLSPTNLVTPEKRTRPQPFLLAKKIHLGNEHPESETDKERSIDDDDLERIRESISAKKQELEHIKQELLYEKKHEPRDLDNLTERWLRGCQEALVQFQKDIHQNNETAVSMIEILRQLGIPAELVQYSVEDCDFV